MKKDFTPWLLLPGIVLALSSVTLLASHQAAQAAPPVPAQPAPQAAAYDDGDGDELLEHWDNRPYTQEARWQMSGIAAGFLVLGVAACRRRSRRVPLGEIVSLPREILPLTREIVPLPREADFLKLGPDSPAETRKAA